MGVKVFLATGDKPQVAMLVADQLNCDGVLALAIASGHRLWWGLGRKFSLPNERCDTEGLELDTALFALSDFRENITILAIYIHR